MTPAAPRRTLVVRSLVGLLAVAVLALSPLRAAAGGGPSSGPGAPAAVPAPKPAGAQESCAEAVAEQVQRRYDAIHDLRARFIQRTRRVSLGTAASDALQTEGEVVFAKPGRMRWDYQKPAHSLVVSDGTTLWIYDPVAHEVQELPLGPQFLSGAAIEFLLGEGRILDEFRVSASGCGTSAVTLRLVPRRDAPYEHLELVADPATGEVRETSVVDLFGNRTEIQLEHVRVDTGPAASVFRFVPPKGTRVLSVPPAS
jgi:outer membrane lipoprotein carrier protein